MKTFALVLAALCCFLALPAVLGASAEPKVPIAVTPESVEQENIVCNKSSFHGYDADADVIFPYSAIRRVMDENIDERDGSYLDDVVFPFPGACKVCGLLRINSGE